MHNIRTMNRIKKMSRKQKEYFFDKFSSIVKIAESARNRSEATDRFYEKWRREQIEPYIPMHSENLKGFISQIIRDPDFNEVDLKILLDIAQDSKYPNIASAIVSSIYSEDKTKEFATEKIDTIIGISLNSNTSEMAEAVGEVDPYGPGFDPIQHWNNMHQDPIDQYEQKSFAQNQLNSIEKDFDIASIKAYMKENPGNESQVIQNIIQTTRFTGKKGDRLLEIAKGTSEQDVANAIITTLAENPKTKRDFTPLIQELMDQASKTKNDVFMKALEEVSPGISSSPEDVPPMEDVPLGEEDPSEESVAVETVPPVDETIVSEPVTNIEVIPPTPPPPEVVEDIPAPVEIDEPIIEEPPLPLENETEPISPDPTELPQEVTVDSLAMELGRTYFSEINTCIISHEKYKKFKKKNQKAKMNTFLFKYQDAFKAVNEGADALIDKYSFETNPDTHIIIVQRAIKLVSNGEITQEESTEEGVETVETKSTGFNFEKSFNLLKGGIFESDLESNGMKYSPSTKTIKVGDLINIPVEAIVKEDETGKTISFLPSVDLSILTSTFDLFNKINSKPGSAEDVQKTLIDNFFGGRYKELANKTSREFRGMQDVSDKKGADIFKRNADTYKFYTGIQSDILGLYYKFAISSKLSGLAVDEILKVLEGGGEFTSDDFARISEVNISEGRDPVSSDELNKIIAEYLKPDVAASYARDKQINEEAALQGELLLLSTNANATRLQNFCMVCGKFRQGGSISESGDLNVVNRDYFTELDGELQWLFPESIDPSQQEQLSQWRNQHTSIQKENDLPTDLTSLELKYLSPKAQEVINSGCQITFDAQGNPIGPPKCKIIKNYHYVPQNTIESIEVSRGLTEELPFKGIPISVRFGSGVSADSERQEGEDEEKWKERMRDDNSFIPVKVTPLDRESFEYHISDLTNLDLNGGVETIDYNGKKITLDEAISMFLTRGYKHCFPSYKNRKRSAAKYSIENGIKEGEEGDEEVYLEDGEVIQELSLPIANLFIEIEKNKILADPSIREEFINDFKQNPMGDSVEDAWEKWLREKSLRRGLRSYYSFKPDPTPNLTLSRQTHPGDKPKGSGKNFDVEDISISEEGLLLWTGFMSNAGLVDGSPVQKGVTNAHLFSPSSVKTLTDSLHRELKYIIINSQTFGLTEEEKEKILESIVESYIGNSLVGLPPSSSEDFQSIITTALFEIDQNGLNRKEHLTKVIKESIENRRKIAQEAMSNPELLAPWNLAGVGLDENGLKELTVIVLNQLNETLTSSPIKPGDSQVGSSGALPRDLVGVLRQYNFGFITEQRSKGGEPFKHPEGITPNSEKVLAMVKDLIAQKGTGQLKTVDQWKGFLGRELFGEFKKYYGDINADMFFDVLNLSISDYIDVIQRKPSIRGKHSDAEEGKNNTLEFVSNQLGIPVDVLDLMQMEHNLLSDTIYNYAPPAKKGNAQRTQTGIPANIWFLKTFMYHSDENADFETIIKRMASERRDLLKIRETFDEESTRDYIIAAIQRDINKLIKPQELGQIEAKLEGNEFNPEDNPLFDMLKILPEDLKEELIKVFTDNEEANKILLGSIDSQIESWIPTVPSDVSIHGIDLKTIDSIEGKEAMKKSLRKTYPLMIDDIEKSMRLPEPASDVLLDNFSRNKFFHLGRRVRQIMSHLGLNYSCRRDRHEKPEETRKRMARENITEASLECMLTNKFRGQLTNRNTSLNGYGSIQVGKGNDAKFERGINFHFLNKIAPLIMEATGRDITMAFEHHMGLRESLNNNWYKKSIIEFKLKEKAKVKNITHPLIIKEMVKFNWYKSAQKPASPFELVMVYSSKSAQDMYRNILNSGSKTGMIKMPVFSIVPFSDFGSLSNVHDFNVNSDLFAQALTRKQCDLFRSMKLID